MIVAWDSRFQQFPIEMLSRWELQGLEASGMSWSQTSTKEAIWGRFCDVFFCVGKITGIVV